MIKHIKEKRKKSINILLALYGLFTLLSCMEFFTPETWSKSTSRSICANEFNEYSIDDIRRIVDSGGQVYQTLRVYSLTEGVKTYQTLSEMSEEECIEFIIGNGVNIPWYFVKFLTTAQSTQRTQREIKVLKFRYDRCAVVSAV